MNKVNNKKLRFKKFNKKKEKQVNGKGYLNDPAWYMQNPLLSKLTSVVNFISMLGSRLRITQNGIKEANERITPGTPKAWIPQTLPGIMALKWFPTPGVSRNADSPINKAMSKLFTQLRLKNVSLSAYDPVDVIFYILICDSILSFYGYLSQVYTHAKKYSFQNNYMPKALLTALNVDFDDIIQNLDRLLILLSITREAIEKLQVPKALHFIARHLHMSANVYKDTECEKSQMYVFVPAYLYKYDATQPALVPVLVGDNPTLLTFSDLESIMNGLLQTVLPDEDMGIIAADLVKYFGGEFWRANEIDWGTSLEPVYNEQMLWQIHNANFLPYSSVANPSITQVIDSNLNTILEWDPTYTSYEAGVGLKRILDSNSEAPDSVEVIESTRLMFTVKDFNSTGVAGTPVTFKLGSCGSEVIVNAKLYHIANDGTLMIKDYTTFVKIDYASDLSNVRFAMDSTNPNCMFGTDLYSIIAGGSFKLRPTGYLIQHDNNEDVFGGIFTELNNYAVLEDTQVDYLHEQSLLSEFNFGHTIQ